MPLLRTLYLESYAGIAGDMFTAAFLDAGLVDPHEIEAVPALLGFSDVTVTITETQRANARFLGVRVSPPGEDPGDDPGLLDLGEVRHPGAHGHHHPSDGEAIHSHRHEPGHDHTGDHDHPHHHHHYTELVRRLEASDLAPEARDFALKVFRLLAEAEADSHGVPVEEVAFHEVGAVDSVVDVAMAGVCVASVAPGQVLASPVKLGRGQVRIQHGTYPVPPPASAHLAVGMPVAPVPEAITRTDVELSTPTGLAILKALNPAFVEGWPSGTLLAQGAGAGTMDLGDYPNIFRVALFRESESSEGVGAPGSPYHADTVVEVRCNVDDQTGERTAWLMEKALVRGALDGWVTQVLGKKGRPALVMTLLVHPRDVPELADFLLRHSSTYGVRFAPWDRLKLAREEETRDTPRGPVRFKVGRTRTGEIVKEKAEVEDLRRVWEDDPGFSP